MLQTIVSIIIITFLVLLFAHALLKPYIKLYPWYRNHLLLNLEGFEDASGSTTVDISGSTMNVSIDVSGTSVASTPSNVASTPSIVASTPSNVASTPSNVASTPSNVASTPSNVASTPSTVAAPSAPSYEPDEYATEKATQMADLFERVNSQMDVLRTLKLSDLYMPVKLDKSATEPYVILSNMRLLINNGIYKNELDLKDVNDTYIGNKGVLLLASDINSFNMEQSDINAIRSAEASFIKRAQTIVDAHQKLISKVLENKSKQ